VDCLGLEQEIFNRKEESSQQDGGPTAGRREKMRREYFPRKTSSQQDGGLAKASESYERKIRNFVLRCDRFKSSE